MQRFLSLFLSCLLLLNTCLAGVVCAEEEVLFYHTDNFGTPVAMTDLSGKVVWRADELPFGEGYTTEEISTRNNHRYLGKELDKETGLIYLGARYLDPKTGRFNRPDPVQLVAPATGKINQQMLLNPQRQNRYVYGLNNPYRYADADGNFAILGTLLVTAAIFYFSHPDVANAPERSSSRTYKSHGARTIALGVASGVGIQGVSSVLAGRKISEFVVRTTRSGDKAVRLTKKNGSVVDITPSRVKEYKPTRHSNAPPGTLNKVKFKNAIAGSKGYKRSPTPNELRILKKYK